MSRPAARLTDMHTCPMVTPGLPPIPHVGGPINAPGSTNVFIEGLPAARVTDQCVCIGPPDVIVKGSMGVFINMLPAARVGDQTAHGGVIVAGAMKVFIGEAGAAGAAAPGAPTKVAVKGSSGVSKGILDNKAKSKTSIAVSVEKKASKALYKKGGLSLGKGEARVGSEMSVDLGGRAVTLKPIDAKISAVAAEYEAKATAAENLLNGKVKAEAGRVEASASAALTANKDGVVAEASAGASAIAAQVEGETNVRLTLKTISDNTIGRITGYKLPARYDKGIEVGVRGNAGFGAAAQAKAKASVTKQGAEALVEAKAGCGPLVGMAIRMALIW